MSGLNGQARGISPADAVRDVCMPLVFHLHTEEHVLDTPWVVGVSVLGLLLGVAVASLLVKCYLSKLRGTEGRSEFKKQAVSQRALCHAVDFEENCQDLTVLNKLEKDLDEERETMYLHVLQDLLSKELIKDGQSDTVASDVMKKIKELQEEKEIFRTEYNNILLDPAQNETLSKAEKVGDIELESSRAAFQKLKRQMEQEMKKKIKKNLQKSGLDDSKVQELLDKLRNEMAKVGVLLDAEQTRQIQMIQDRQLNRKHVAENKLLIQKEESDSIENSIGILDSILKRFVNDERITEKQKNDLQDEYRNNLQKISESCRSAKAEEQEILSKDLEKKRAQELQKLADDQAKEKAAYLEMFGKEGNITTFVQGYHELLQKMHIDQEHRIKDCDKLETEEFFKLQKDLTNLKANKMIEAETELFDMLKKKAKLKETDVEAVLKLHQRQQMEFDGKRLQERQRMKEEVNRKIEEKKKQQEEQVQHALAEKRTLQAQQESMINKVLETNVELSEEQRKKILKDHENNMQTLNSQLQLSRFKQEKSLELKLSQRRARLEEIRELQARKGDTLHQEREKLQQELQAQIAAEEKKLAEEQQADIANLQEQLRAETSVALEQQEQNLAAAIGQLQVSQARRQAVCQQQDIEIQKLQEKLQNHIVGVGTEKTSEDKASQIVEQHLKNMMSIKENLSHDKARLEKKIEEKLETKRLQNLKLSDTNQNQQFHIPERRGVSLAESILLKMFSQQKQKMKLQNLEQQTKVELEKTKKRLKEKLEKELQEKLEAQKQQFIAKLASVSMSEEEMAGIITSTVSDVGDQSKQHTVIKNFMNQLKLESSDREGEENDSNL